MRSRMVDELNKSQQILSKGIKSVDLRLDGRVMVEVAEVKAEDVETGKKKKVAKSQLTSDRGVLGSRGVAYMTVVQFQGKGGPKTPAVHEGRDRCRPRHRLDQDQLPHRRGRARQASQFRFRRQEQPQGSGRRPPDLARHPRRGDRQCRRGRARHPAGGRCGRAHGPAHHQRNLCERVRRAPAVARFTPAPRRRRPAR